MAQRAILSLALATGLLTLAAAGAAPTAHAEEGMLTSDGPVTLTGVNTGGGTNIFTVFGFKASCPNVLYTGHSVNTSEPLPGNGSASATVTPSYEHCTFGGFPATIAMNGCDYVLNLGNTTGEEGAYAAATEIVCPENQHIEMKLFTSTDFKQLFCVARITESGEAYAGLQVEELEEGGNIRLSGSIEGITAHKEAGRDSAIFCPQPLPENTTTEEMVLDLDVTIAGHAETGGLTEISISES